MKQLTKADRRILYMALGDAIRDREAYWQAWQPLYSKPDAEALKVIRDTKRLIAKYKRLQAKIREINSCGKSALATKE